MYVYVAHVYSGTADGEYSTLVQQQPPPSQRDQPSGPKLESGSGSSLKSDQSAATNKTTESAQRRSQDSQLQQQSTTAITSSEEPTASIFLQTAAYLLDVHALKVYTHSQILRRVLRLCHNVHVQALKDVYY